MSDGIISTKYQGDSTDNQRAIAALEKKYDELKGTITEAKSAAKAAAKQAAEDLKRHQKEVQDDAMISRKVFRQTTAALKKEEQEQTKAQREAARDAKQQARDVAAEKKRAARDAANAVKQNERDTARETRRIVHEEANDSRRVFRQTTAALKKEHLERKRVAREQKMADNQLTGWITGLVGVQSGYAAVVGLIQSAVTHQQKLVELSDEHGKSQDRLSRNFALQAGLTAIQGKESQKSINAEGIRAGVTAEKAGGAATQLVSSDFSHKEASGKSLRALLAAQAAAGDQAGDSEEFALAVSMLLSAGGLEKNAANVERVGKIIYGGKKAGNMKASDIQFIAPKIQGFIKQGGSLEEAVGGFVAMEDTANREQSATAIKIMRERLAGAAGRKIGAKLKKYGIDPDKVDYVGESELEVNKYLKAKIDKLPKAGPGNQAGAIQDIFGGDAGSAVTGALDRIDRYEKMMAAMKDGKGYAAAVGMMQSGDDFDARQIAERQKLWHADRFTTQTTRASERDLARKDAGMSSFRSDFILERGKQARYLGLDDKAGEHVGSAYSDPKTLALMSNPVTGAYGGMKLLGDLLFKNSEKLEENTKAVQLQNENMKGQPADPKVKAPNPVGAGANE